MVTISEAVVRPVAAAAEVPRLVMDDSIALLELLDITVLVVARFDVEVVGVVEAEVEEASVVVLIDEGGNSSTGEGVRIMLSLILVEFSSIS